MASDRRREMVQDDIIPPSSSRRMSAQPRHRKDKKGSRTGRSSTIVDSPPNDKPADLEALRKARLEYINTSVDERKKKMKYVGETIVREPAQKADIQHVRKVSGSNRRRKGDPERKHRERKVSVTEAEIGEYQSVYERRSRKKDVEPRIVEEEDKDTDKVDRSDAQLSTPPEPIQPSMGRRSKTGDAQRPSRKDGPVDKRRQTPRRRQSEPVEGTHHVRRNSYGIDVGQPASIPR